MSNYAHPEALVDTAWLAAHLNDATVRIVEVDTSPEQHQNAHIPGAVFWNSFTDLLLPNLSINFDPAAMAGLLSRSGITPETIVIAYGSYPGTGAWIFWLLNVFGHTNVRVLNGGQRKWVAEGRPVTAELAQFPPTQYPIPQSNVELRVFQKEVQDSLGRSDRLLLDVRTAQEYQGEWFLMKPPEGSEQAGHIPGAVHLPHDLALNEDGTFRSVEELQALYQDKGVTADQEIFPYCAVGGRSGFVWFVLKYLLGYPQVRNYDGSWNEWSRVAHAPIEK